MNVLAVAASYQLPNIGSELAFLQQSKSLPNKRHHVRLDLITVTFVLVLVALCEPSFHLCRGRRKLGSAAFALSNICKSKQTLVNSSQDSNVNRDFRVGIV